jgi:hypothetical protein
MRKPCKQEALTAWEDGQLQASDCSPRHPGSYPRRPRHATLMPLYTSKERAVNGRQGPPERTLSRRPPAHAYSRSDSKRSHLRRLRLRRCKQIATPVVVSTRGMGRRKMSVTQCELLCPTRLATDWRRLHMLLCLGTVDVPPAPRRCTPLHGRCTLHAAAAAASAAARLPTPPCRMAASSSASVIMGTAGACSISEFSCAHPLWPVFDLLVVAGYDSTQRKSCMHHGMHIHSVRYRSHR